MTDAMSKPNKYVVDNEDESKCRKYVVRNQESKSDSEVDEGSNDGKLQSSEFWSPT